MNQVIVKIHFKIFLIMIILAINSCADITNTLQESKNCSLIENLSKLEELNFDFENHGKYLDKKYSPISGLLYDSIFSKLAIIKDSSRIIGQFPLSFNRTGLICYNKAYECDHSVDYVDLNIIENCQIVNRLNLSLNDDEMMIYNLRSGISKNFDTLFTTIEHSSEWAVGEINPVDTLFIESVAIDLRTKNFDTILHKTKIKKLLN